MSAMFVDNAAMGRPAARRDLTAARAHTDGLFAWVQDHLYERPIAERHRLIFYLGHLDAFDWNLLRAPLALEVFDADFDALFAFGIDPVDGRNPDEPPEAWPTVAKVRDYVQRIRTQLDEALQAQPEDPALTAFDPDAPAVPWLLQVAIEHRLMHMETLGYLINQMEPLLRATVTTQPPRRIESPKPVLVPAGPLTLGAPRDGTRFGWDNEFLEQELHVEAFRMAPYMVTNAMYLDFVEAGGYQAREHWSDTGWAWREAADIEHPALWRRNGDDWHWMTMDDVRPLPPDWPVYVSHAEASAYARWSGQQLPSEAQWQRAAYGGDARRPWPWGNATPNAAHGNFDFQGRNPVDVDACPEGASEFGIHGLLGNGWEWTATPFAPLPGFKAYPFYPRYSTLGFDGQHYVVKGGSAWTAQRLLRRSFRNWYQAHYQPIFAGFRCVQPA